jgi:hypothetical protein
VAKHMGVSRARVCQMLNLLKLPDDIIEYIHDLENPESLLPVTERRLRTVLRSENPKEAFQLLL